MSSENHCYSLVTLNYHLFAAGFAGMRASKQENPLHRLIFMDYTSTKTMTEKELWAERAYG
jgi:hypothetical protein